MRVLRGFALLMLAAGAGCYGTVGYDARVPADVAVTVAPPEPLYETPPPPPALADVVWIGGYWDWDPAVGRYVWIGGRWERAPRAGVVYVPPRWEREPRGWVRAPGRWVPGQSVDRLGRRVWFDANGRAHYF
jgi:hypothetical protein